MKIMIGIEGILLSDKFTYGKVLFNQFLSHTVGQQAKNIQEPCFRTTNLSQNPGGYTVANVLCQVVVDQTLL